MITTSLDDIQSDFLGYLRKVQEGETILIVDAETLIAELRPAAASATQPRPFGLCAGEFVVPEDFDAPLPESVLREFEGA